MNSFPSPVAAEWASRLAQVPERHRGPTFGRCRDVALWWCASGLADHATALGWDETEIFGVRSGKPFLRPDLLGLALTGAPRFLTDHSAHFANGRVIRRGQFGPDFIPVWCLDRRLKRPERHLVQLPSGLWALAQASRAA